MKTTNFHFGKFLLLFTLFAGSYYFITSSDRLYEAELELENADSKLKPGDWHFRQRAFPYGKVDGEAIRQALSHRQAKLEKNRQFPTGKLNATAWEFSGPTNIGGRVTDIEMIAGNPDVILVGSASGGIFRTSDMGNNWESIFDDALSLSIGDMALAPTDQNVIYVGTGEANAGGGSLAYDGMGIYKSTDGGSNWSHLGLMNIGSVGKVAVAIDDPNTCFVGAMGHLFENNPERGLYRTQDGGATWEQSLFINDSTGVIDIALHPTDANIIYAAAWERVRRPDRRSYGGPSSGIYKSIDGGDSWTKLSGGLPATAGRIALAISKSNPDILYTSFVNEDSGLLKGIYKTTNAGDSWTTMSMEGIENVPFMWWFGKMAVADDNPDVVHLVGFYMHKSTDGANSWAQTFEFVHVDQHAICIDANDSDFILIGNDGGIYRSTDGGQNSTKLEGLPITQFYSCEIDASQPDRLYGGTQDNSTMRTLTGNIDNWEIIYFGDGFQTLVDPSDNSFVYTEFQYGNFAKSINGGLDFTPALNGIDPVDRKNWNTPVIFHPNYPSILFFGTNKLYKSENRAELWFPLSLDVTTNPAQNNLVYGTITTISVSPIDDEIIYIGTDDGRIQRFEDGGTSTNNTNLSPVTNRWVTAVAADPNETASVYTTFSGYRYGENIGHVYHSLDYGDSWADISGDLPDIPVNDIIIVPGSKMLVVATDAGVYFSVDNGEVWELLGLELPNVVVTDLDYHEPTNVLVAATYGRGMFNISLDEWTVDVTEALENNLNATILPNPLERSSKLELVVDKRDNYSIGVVNPEGKNMETIHTGILSQGIHQFDINAMQWASGVYILNIRNGVEVKSIQLVKP